MEKERFFLDIPEKFIDRIIGNYNPVVIITTNNAQAGQCWRLFAMCMEVMSYSPTSSFWRWRNKGYLSEC